MVRQTSSWNAATRCIVVVVVVCLLGQILAQHDAPHMCLGRNPFLRYLKRHEVEVFDAPQPSTSKICICEWKTHSTCCDGKSLVKYAKKDIEQLGKDIKDVKKDVMKVKDYFNDNEDKIKKAIKNAKLKDKEKEEFLDKLKEDLKDLHGEIKSVFGKEDKVDDERDECFNRIIQIRTASMCSICSGRGTEFLLKGHIQLSMEDCRNTINKCGDTWRKSIDLVDAIVLAKRIRKQLKEVIPKGELMNFEDNEIERFREWIGSEHLRAPIKECDGKAKDCSDASATLLCETFISFRKHGFLSDLGDMIEHHHPNKGQANPPPVVQPPVVQPPVVQPPVVQPPVVQPPVVQPSFSDVPHIKANKETSQKLLDAAAQLSQLQNQSTDNNQKLSLKKLSKDLANHFQDQNPNLSYSSKSTEGKSQKNQKKLNWKLGKSRLLQTTSSNPVDNKKSQDFQISSSNPVNTGQPFDCTPRDNRKLPDICYSDSI